MEEVIGQRWAYRCEGKSNLVVADTQRSVVLRILKEPLALPEDIAGAVVQKKVRRIKAFFEEMVHPRLRYALVPKIVQLDTGTMKDIKSQIGGQRPAHRKNEEKGIRTVATVALELPDLCSTYAFGSASGGAAAAAAAAAVSAAPVFTIEIKPKMGYLLQPPTSPASGQFCATTFDGLPHNGTQTFGCFMCVSERYPNSLNNKMDAGGRLMTTVTNFCPVDLFSGNRKRMVYALGALLDSRQTLPNRFRLFKDGVQVRPTADRSDLDRDQHRQLITASLHPYFRDASGQTSVDELLSLLVESLLHTDKLSDAGDTLHADRTVPEDSSMTVLNSSVITLASNRIQRNIGSSSSNISSTSAQQKQQQQQQQAAELHSSDMEQANRDLKRGLMVGRTCDFSPLLCADTDWRPAPLPEGCVLEELLRALCRSRETGESIYERHYVHLVRAAAAVGHLSTFDSPSPQLPPQQQHPAAAAPSDGRHCDGLRGNDDECTHAQLERLHLAALNDPDFDWGVDLSNWWNTSGSLDKNGFGDTSPATATLCDSAENSMPCNRKAPVAPESAGHCQATDASMQTISDFLFAKTVKDCSIMITVQPLETAASCPPSRAADSSNSDDGKEKDEQCGTFVVQDSARAASYRVKVALIDLDPKPFSKIPVYARLQRHYVRSLLSGLCCCG